MKHAVAFILILSLLLSLPVTASAEEHHTTVTGVVPEFYSLTVPPFENGHVFHEGRRIDGGTIELHFRSEPTVTILPDSGYVIDQVLLNGVDVTDQVIGGFLTLPPVAGDSTLAVTLKPSPQQPESSTRIQVEGTVYQDGQPLSGVTVELRPGSRYATTDSRGRFSFRNVPEGSHQLLVWKEGTLAGYTQVEISTDTALEVEKEDGGYLLTVPVTVVTVNLEVHLPGDGTIDLSTSQSSRPPHMFRPHHWSSGTGNPRTGDIIMVSVTIMLLSGAGLVYMLFWWKKRKNQENKE